MTQWSRKLRKAGVVALLTCLSATVPLSACSAIPEQAKQAVPPKPAKQQVKTQQQNVSDVLPLPVKIPEQQPAAVTPPKPAPQPKPLLYRSPKVEATQNGTKLIRVPAIHQHPQLPTGCEVTSLAMLLHAVGKPVGKMQLAREIQYDPTPIRYNPSGTKITHWGNPSVGFVGKMDGSSRGFGVYHGPIAALLNRHLPHSAVDLTGQPFEVILEKVKQGKPVVVWTTVPLRPTSDRSGWNTKQGHITMTWNEHAVLLVGYGPNSVYINDPYDGVAAKRVNRTTFEQSWVQLGKQAVSVK